MKHSFVLTQLQRFLLLSLLGGSILLFAQNDPSAPPGKVLPHPDVFTLRKNVRRVVVDVVVRGPDNKPIRGMLAKNFTVSEDSQPQRVLTFEAHEFDTPSIALPADGPKLPPNIFVNVPSKPERGPLYVILYDMVNMETDDQITARQQVMKFIRGIPAGARFAVYVHSEGLHLVQGFTSDRDQVFAALDPEHPKAHVPMSFLMSRNFGRGDPVAMMSVFTHIGEFLDGIPGRKNLIWIAGTFPVSLYARQGDPLDLRNDTREELNSLARAEVAVYPINVRGVITNPEGALNGAGPHTGAGGTVASVGPPAGTPAPAMAAPSPISTVVNSGVGPIQGTGGVDSVYSDNMMQNDIANATGGRAFYSDNGIKEILDDAVEDGGNYYTLTYSPTNPNYDGSLRRISVTLNQRGYHLAYRHTYYADDPDAPQVQSKKKEAEEESPEEIEAKNKEHLMYANLQHGAPLIHQLIFKVRIHAVGAPGLATPAQMTKLEAFSRGKHGKAAKPVRVQSYAIYYVIVASQIKHPKGQAVPLEFAAVAYDPEGFIANGIFENVADESLSNPFSGLQAAPPESWEPDNQTVYRAMQELDVPVNATSLRVAVRDTSNDRVGALEIPLPLVPETDTEARSPGTSEGPGQSLKTN